MVDHPPMQRRAGSRRERDRQIRTVCQECSVACGLVVDVKDERIVDVEGDEDHPASRGRLCARGIAFVQGATAPERLTVPAVRVKRGDAWRPLADWNTGLDLLAERLRELRARHGPDALVIGCDREAGLEFEMGARRFAQLWGTAQVFHTAGVPRDPWPDGWNGPTAPAAEWIHARSLLLVEADLAATHPVAFGWILEAQRRGARVAAVDARFTPTLAKADLPLRARQGRGNLLGLALAKLLLEGRGSGTPAAGGVADAGWRASLERMSLDGAEGALGIPLDDLRRLCALLAGHGPATVITGRELCALPHHRVWLALALATGWVGRAGGGWYPLDAGQPAFAVEGDDAAAPGPREGRRLAEITRRGDVRAVVCSGNALAEDLSPFGELEGAELVAHFGAFPGGSWERATMTFPASLWAERDGLVFDGDGSLDWGRGIVAPPGACRSGLDFWVGLALRFGWEKHFPWAAEDGAADRTAFHEWLLARSTATSGVSLAELRERGPGPVRLGLAGEGMSPAVAAALAASPAPTALVSEDAAEAQERAEYPLSLVRARSGVRSGDASRFWSWTSSLARDEALQIHPDTAERLGIEHGDEVLVDTPRGALEARACLSRAVSRRSLGSLRAVNALPALVRRKGQPAEEARALLAEARP